MKNKSSDTRFTLGFFLGGLIGAAVLYLMGTKDGQKKSRVLEEKAREFFDHVRDQFDDVAEKGREKVVDVSEVVGEKADETLSHIEKLQERGRENTATLRKKLFKNAPKR